MSRCLRDASAYSAFMRGNESVRAAIGEAVRIVLTPTVLGELRAGFRGGSRRERNEELLRRFRGSSRVSTIPIDEDTAGCYAEIVTSLRRASTPISTNDTWIAASALQHGLRILTTDGDFRRVPQVAVDLMETG